MLTLKYSDLTDSRTLAYKNFDKLYKSIEAREKQIERERQVLCGLTAKMQDLGEITYDQYNLVMAWMNHSDKPWYEILRIVFDEK